MQNIDPSRVVGINFVSKQAIEKRRIKYPIALPQH